MASEKKPANQRGREGFPSHVTLVTEALRTHEVVKVLECTQDQRRKGNC